MLNMIDQCEKYMAWIKHYASKLAYLLWLTPSGQVAHVTLDRRLCRTRIFILQKYIFCRVLDIRVSQIVYPYPL